MRLQGHRHDPTVRVSRVAKTVMGQPMRRWVQKTLTHWVHFENVFLSVESQKDFHVKKAAEQAALLTTPSTTRATPPPEIRTKPHVPIPHITVITATEASLHTRENTIPEFIPPPQPFVPTSTTTSTTSTTPTTTSTTAMATTTIAPST